jgi:AraC-like DNA-binding protein
VQKAKQKSRKQPGKLRDRATIRALFLEPVASELLRCHAPLDDLLRKHGLARADLKSPYARLPLRAYIELMEEAAEATSNESLGLALGSSFRLEMLGPLCALMQSAKSLRQALGIFEKFQAAWQANTSLIVTRDEETTCYRYGIEDPAIWPRRQDTEFTIAAIVSIVRQLSTPKWAPALVEFEHAVQPHQRRLAEFFKAPVRGSMEFNGITIGDRDLDRPLHGPADGNLDRAIGIAEQHLKDLMFGDGDDAPSVTEATASCIARRLGCSSVDIDVVARELNLSARTLRRKLEEEGTSFREMLQEQRRRKAEKLLSTRGFHISELAGRLGYSDTAVFSRAFKSWTGLSPKQFSRQTSRTGRRETSG